MADKRTKLKQFSELDVDLCVKCGHCFNVSTAERCKVVVDTADYLTAPTSQPVYCGCKCSPARGCGARCDNLPTRSLDASKEYVRGLGVTVEVANKLLNIREALARNNVEDAWHWLYKIADPEVESLTPWKELEAAALHLSASGDKEMTSSNEAKTPLATTAIPKDIQLEVADLQYPDRLWLKQTHEENGWQFGYYCHKPQDDAFVEYVRANPITQDGASASAQTQNVTDKGSVQHETELIRMLRLRKELDPDAPDAIVFSESESSISSTLAEIRNRRAWDKFNTDPDILTLLSIIDSLQAEKDQKSG